MYNLPTHKCGLYLIHNEHKDVYETVESYYELPDFISQAEWENAVKQDSVWILHWYPDNPVSFFKIAASSLDAVLEAAQRIEEQTKQGVKVCLKRF